MIPSGSEGSVPPGDRDERDRWYRVLAEGLVARPRGTTVVFESTLDDPVPRVRGDPGLPSPCKLAGPDGTPTGRETGGPPLPRLASRQVGGVVVVRDLVALASRDGRWGDPAQPVRELLSRRALAGASGQLWVRTLWTAGGEDGRLWVGRRFALRVDRTAEAAALLRRAEGALATEWALRTGRPVRATPSGPTGRVERTWGWWRPPSRASWFELDPARAAATAEPLLTEPQRLFPSEGAHAVVFGATGAGKTWFLADRTARALRDGATALVLDLHGDLSGALVTRLSAPERKRLIGIDVTRRPVLGLAPLGGTEERAAAHLVSAVRRLSPDGAEVYWGFRLERLFDAFVRVVQETGGSLLDLYGLLTDPERREVARLATRRPEVARFLDELAPIVRRTPDFLWPAAARLSKIALVPALAELLCPPDGGIGLERLLAEGRSLVVRLPFVEIGPEAAAFAGSLLLTRAYLGVAARSGERGPAPRLLTVLDEVQGLSPRLLAEMLAEGRKFGFRLLLASQYPERLAPELRAAAAGAAREVVVFRVPPVSAAGVGSWLGLPPATASMLLPALATGTALTRPRSSAELVRFGPGENVVARRELWSSVVAASQEEFGATPRGSREGSVEELLTDRILLAALAAEEQGQPLRPEATARAVGELPGGRKEDPAVVADRLALLVRRGLLRCEDGRVLLSPAGERRLGLRTVTGATREGPEHRALLLRAFRLFARRGYHLEIVAQGRYDTTLPDGVFHQLPGLASRSPRELAEALARAQPGWAWRFFGGRDVHVEAEVSGAVRPPRVRHGVLKAVRRGAFPLFVVGDARRASRVRRTLRTLGLGPREAQVWTLPDRTSGTGRRGAGPRPGETS